MKGSKKVFWTLWAATAAGTFSGFFFGVKYVLRHVVFPANLFAYLIVSLLFGALPAALYLWKRKIAVWCFLLGLLSGFILMYRAFFLDRSGWGDLAGLITLFLCAGVGLIIGVAAELVRWLLQKFQSGNS